MRSSWSTRSTALPRGRPPASSTATESAAGGPSVADRIDLVTPAGKAWEPVIRLVLGGIAERLQLGFDGLDDLQLAVERLLAEAGSKEGPVSLSFEIGERGVRTRSGGLRERAV